VGTSVGVRFFYAAAAAAAKPTGVGLAFALVDVSLL